MRCLAVALGVSVASALLSKPPKGQAAPHGASPRAALEERVSDDTLSFPGGRVRVFALEKDKPSCVTECPALVLNADYRPLSYSPLSLLDWQSAIKAIVSDKATVVENYELEVRSPSMKVKLPAVIALKEYVKRSGATQTAMLSRRNIFLRDKLTCQYCNKEFAPKDLSIDHVVPRSRGGRLTWHNSATACLACNGRKGHKSLKEIEGMGMKLVRKPYAPTQYQLHQHAKDLKPRHLRNEWADYL